MKQCITVENCLKTCLRPRGIQSFKILALLEMRAENLDSHPLSQTYLEIHNLRYYETFV